MDSFLEYFTSTEETLQDKKQVKVEVAEELKDTCWLEERIFERKLSLGYLRKRNGKGGGGDISHKD